MKIEKNELKPRVGPQANPPPREWRDAILRPHVLSFRLHDGVVGMESVAFDHLLPPGPHSEATASERVLGVMTEPFN